jgi:hypothetical protein
MLGQLIGPSAFIGSLIDEIWPAIMWQCPSSSSAHAADDLIELCDDTADDNVGPADAFIADAYAKVHLLIGTINRPSFELGATTGFKRTSPLVFGAQVIAAFPPLL